MAAEQGNGSLARVAALPETQRVVVLPQYRGLLRRAEVTQVLVAVAKHLKAKLPGHQVKVGTLADHELWSATAPFASARSTAIAALVDTNCYDDDGGRLSCSLAASFRTAGRLHEAWPKHLKARVLPPGTLDSFVAAAAALQEDDSAWFGVEAWQGKAPEIGVRYTTASAELGEAAQPDAVEKAMAGATECRSADDMLALRVLAVADASGKVTYVESYLADVGNRRAATPAQLRCVQATARGLRFAPAQTSAPRRLVFDLSIAPTEAAARRR
jgi:hypothetical protein